MCHPRILQSPDRRKSKRQRVAIGLWRARPIKEVAFRRTRPGGRIAAGARLQIADDRCDHRSTINRLPQRLWQERQGFGGTSAPAAATSGGRAGS